MSDAPQCKQRGHLSMTGGQAGKLREGHAWVTFEKDGRFYLLEPRLAGRVAGYGRSSCIAMVFVKTAIAT
jgi:hypothetical protein